MTFIQQRHEDSLPLPVRNFISYTLSLARQGSVEEVAAAFFFGREKLIPEMFTSILQALDSHKNSYPSLLYYLQRHIEVDQHDHGPLSRECLEILCHQDKVKWDRALQAASTSLDLRSRLWDGVCQRIAMSSQTEIASSCSTLVQF